MLTTTDRPVEIPDRSPETPTAPSRAARTKGPAWEWSMALIVSITTWTDINRAPTDWVDDSWRYTLLHAASEGFDFGADIAFTYGPLVFLDGGPMHTPLTGLGALVVRLALGVMVALLVLRSTGRLSWRPLYRVATAWILVAALVPPDRYGETLALASCAWMLFWLLDSGRIPTRASIGFGALAGLWLTVKPSAALVVLAAVVLASIPGALVPDTDLRARLVAAARCALVPTLTAAASMTVAWTVSGQRLDSLPRYFVDWMEVTRGFAGGMAQSTPLLFGAELILLYASIVLAGAIVLLAWKGRTPALAAAAILCLAVLFWTRQIGMARADGNHMKDAGVSIALLAVAAWPRLVPRLGGPLVIASASLAAALALQPIPPLVGTIPVAGSVVHFASDATTLAGGAQDAVEGFRDELAAEYEVDPTILDAIGDATVHISPQDTNVAFAHPEIGFWVLPTVQHYPSYTAPVEERNVAALTGPDGPRFVLHRPVAKVDSHRPAWDSPAINLALFCSFEPSVSDDDWTLLERRAADCAAPESLGDPTPISAVVPVPEAARSCEGAVTFRIEGAERRGLDRLAQLFVRLPRPFVTTQGEEWPLIPATASQPHLIAAPRADLRWLGEHMPGPETLVPELEIEDLDAFFGPTEAPTIHFECWTRE